MVDKIHPTDADHLQKLEQWKARGMPTQWFVDRDKSDVSKMVVTRWEATGG